MSKEVSNNPEIPLFLLSFPVNISEKTKQAGENKVHINFGERRFIAK